MPTPRQPFARSSLALAALMLLSAAPAGSALAANACTWTPSTGDWGSAGNWSCNSVPTAATQDSATIASGKAVTVSTAQSIYTLSNAGTIGISGAVFTLGNGGSTTNTGVINIGGAATGILDDSNNINNTGGLINIGAGSSLVQSGTTISGGTIATTGTGALSGTNNGNNFLSGVTLNGTLDLSSAGNAVERIANGLTLNGAVNIANGGALVLDSASTSGGNQTVAGTGSINLNDANARLAFDGNGTTVLGSGITIHGQGNIGQPVFNGGTNGVTFNGLISADVSGGTLTLVAPGGSGNVTSNGTLQATGGGILALNTSVLNNGQIIAQNGSTVVQNGVALNGVISTVGTGLLLATNNSANFLNASNFTGTLDVSTNGNAVERVINGLTINGNVNIANGGAVTLDSANTSAPTQTISGTASINLNDANARLAFDGNGTTVLGSGITIHGQGNIGQSLFNGGTNLVTINGLVSSDVAGGTLTIVAPAGSGSITNNGTFQAVNGGTLALNTSVLNSATGQLLSGAGSTVVQNGVTVNGTFVSSGGGAFLTTNNSANFLNASNFTGTLDVSTNGNAVERVINGLTINGNVNIANGGAVTLDSASTTTGSQTVGGSASINLNDPGARLAFDGNGSTILGSGITIHGQGNIGQPLYNGGTNLVTINGLVSSDVAGGTLTLVAPAGSGSLTATNTVQAINGATLALNTSVNNQGQILVQTGSTVVQNGVTVNGLVNTVGTGKLLTTNNGANFLNGATLNGTLDVSTNGNSLERVINGLTINGAVNIANGGAVTLDSANTGAPTQTISGTASINLNDANARLAFDGNGTTVLGSGITIHGQGNIGQPLINGGTNLVTINGLVSSDVAGGTLTLVAPAGSGSLTTTNTVQAINGATLALNTSVNNQGQILAQTGSTVVQNGVTINGLVNTVGTGKLLTTNNGANFLNGATLNGTLDASTNGNSVERVINGLTINGAVNIANGGVVVLDSSGTTGGVQTINGTGVINLNDAAARLAVDANGTTTIGSGITVRGQGNIGQPLFNGGTNNLVNNGTFLADGGTLTVSTPAGSGSLTGSGTLQASGGTLVLATGNPSTQGQLLVGAGPSAVNLGSTNVTISSDYNNAQFGTGNSFNARAGVTGTGLILAGGDAAQAITGANVTNGSTGVATLTIGNVRVGANTYDYQIANTGTTGPTLRGAIQTSVNGGNITDARLSGSGVTASNYATGGPGSNTGNLGVTFTTATAGALSPLTGQSVNLTSNFANIGNQQLNIVIGSGAAAYNPASGNATAPVQVANQRVGGSNTAAVTVSNTAAAGGFSEDLNASVSATSGGVTSNGGTISGLLAGSSNTGAITVGVNTATAGAQTGTVTLAYQTNGTVAGVSNGLGAASVGTQAVTVNGNVYQAAAGALQTTALNFGTVQVGQTVSQNLVVRNTATGAAGFVEDLNASFGAANGTGSSLISGTGSLNGILAGTNSSAANGTMTVSVNTASAGTVSGGITVNYATAGAVNGVSNGLGTAAVGSQNFGVIGAIQAAANVINQALPVVGNSSINLGAVRVGDASPTAGVSLTNQATVAPQAALSASITSNGAPITASGAVTLLAPGATNTSGLVVGLNTAVAGNYTGANAGGATLALVSDASNVGGCAPNCQLTLASQQVSVSGKVYSPAAVQANTSAVSFGVVHVGDQVSASGVSITNSGATSALSDVLRGSIGGATGEFTASGSFSSLAAQATDTSSLTVGLNTSTSGAFTGSATATFVSHDADLADLALGTKTVTLTGTVDNYAQAAFEVNSGPTALSQSGNTYTLNFGTVTQGATGLTDILAVLNSATGLADLLGGSFTSSGSATGFSLSGFDAFSGLGAGQSFSGLTVGLDTSGVGSFMDTITLHSAGSNASGYNGALADLTLVLEGSVASTAAVPEPNIGLLLLAGLGAMLGARRVRGRRANNSLER